MTREYSNNKGLLITLSLLKHKLSAHSLHRWLMLLLALPLTIWALTGSYFVLMDLGFIRSDHIKPLQTDYLQADKVLYPITKVYLAYPAAESISLKAIGKHPYYQVKQQAGAVLVDANTGKRMTELSEQQAITMAVTFQHQQAISPDANVFHIALLTENGPAELAKRHLPAWRVDFDDSESTTLYISAKTAEVVTRRHDYWRLFDLFWKWHIMDYDDGEAIDNKLLLTTAILSIVAVFAGVLLVWQRRHRYL